MSVSLYYTARRPYPITAEEKAVCEEIAERYDANYPYGEIYEGFCIYDWEAVGGEEEKNVIFSGATKLPPIEDMNSFFQIANWWLKCLGEIPDHLPGAQWDLHLDDMPLEWGGETRFLFPAEEEDD